jgi:hypothetical protein
VYVGAVKIVTALLGNGLKKEENDLDDTLVTSEFILRLTNFLGRGFFFKKIAKRGQIFAQSDDGFWV